LFYAFLSIRRILGGAKDHHHGHKYRARPRFESWIARLINKDQHLKSLRSAGRKKKPRLEMISAHSPRVAKVGHAPSSKTLDPSLTSAYQIAGLGACPPVLIAEDSAPVGDISE
jgi:hypothetical protein